MYPTYYLNVQVHGSALCPVTVCTAASSSALHLPAIFSMKRNEVSSKHHFDRDELNVEMQGTTRVKCSNQGRKNFWQWKLIKSLLLPYSVKRSSVKSDIKRNIMGLVELLPGNINLYCKENVNKNKIIASRNYCSVCTVRINISGAWHQGLVTRTLYPWETE